MMNLMDDLFDVSQLRCQELFAGELPWDPLKRLEGYLADQACNDVQGTLHALSIVEGNVQIAAGTQVDAFAIIRGNVIIGGECYIGRSLVRDCIIEEGALIGNGCEVARSVILKGAKIYHNSVVLDSIVGSDVGVGGGTLMGNRNLNDATIRVAWNEDRVDTGLLKLGPIVGDGCTFGMGCLAYPGSILGRDSIVGAGVHLQGSHEPRTYVKVQQELKSVTRRRPRRRG